MAEDTESEDNGTQVADAPAAPAAPVTAEGAVLKAEALPAGSPKDLFAALMAKASEETKVIARELGTVLSLHTLASHKADVSGDYTAGDLNK